MAEELTLLFSLKVLITVLNITVFYREGTDTPVVHATSFAAVIHGSRLIQIALVQSSSNYERNREGMDFSHVRDGTRRDIQLNALLSCPVAFLTGLSSLVRNGILL